MDDRLVEHGVNAGMSYIASGGRVHGAAVSPAIRHIGNKMAQVGAIGRVAYSAYQYGKRKLSQSFSQNKKQKMAPSKRRNQSPIVSVPAFSPGRRSSDASMRSASKSLISRRSGSKRIYIGTPGFMKRAGGRIVKKSRSKTGAATSKSAGKFKKGTRKLQPIDYYAKKGVVIAREKGGILASNGTEKAQSALIGHSTFTALQLRADLGRAFVKMLFNKMGVAIYDFGDAVPQSRKLRIEVYYRLYTGDSLHSEVIACDTATTYATIASWFMTSLLALVDGSPDMYFERVYVSEASVATTPAVGNEVVLDLNLTSCQFHIYNKSALKIQNRTVNAAGNIEGDDVDNVPLYGKSYSGAGNWAQFGTKNSYQTLVVTQESTDDPPIATRKFTNADSVAEPVGKGEMRHCTAVGKAHLDPGQIKTDVLIYRKRFSLNSLIRKIGRRAGLESTNRINIGKYRFFQMEKMIQAVATTDVNAITLAYEVDHKTGIVCYCKKSLQTNYIVLATPL